MHLKVLLYTFGEMAFVPSLAVLVSADDVVGSVRCHDVSHDVVDSVLQLFLRCKSFLFLILDFFAFFTALGFSILFMQPSESMVPVD